MSILLIARPTATQTGSSYKHRMEPPLSRLPVRTCVSTPTLQALSSQWRLATSTSRSKSGCSMEVLASREADSSSFLSTTQVCASHKVIIRKKESGSTKKTATRLAETTPISGSCIRLFRSIENNEALDLLCMPA